MMDGKTPETCGPKAAATESRGAKEVCQSSAKFGAMESWTHGRANSVLCGSKEAITKPFSKFRAEGGGRARSILQRSETRYRGAVTGKNAGGFYRKQGSEGRQERRVRSVEVRVVDGAVERAQRALLAFDGQAQLFSETLADQQRGPRHLRRSSGKAGLAARGISRVPAMLQGQARAVRRTRTRKVDVVLLELLKSLHVLLQEAPSPGVRVERLVALILWAAQGPGGGAVLRPVCLDLVFARHAAGSQ